MDVSRPRERVISILNDNDCPSFAVRRISSPILPKQHLSPRLERPQLYRYQTYAKQTSACSPSSEPSTPPLLRHDSSSSTSSAMDNSPSPITPEYPYLDAQSNVITPYDAIIHQATNGYLPSPTTITPLMEAGMMLVNPMQDPTMHFQSKHNGAFQPMPSPAPTSNASTHPPTSAPDVQQSQQQSQQQPPQKKNKYPCPYANSHGCLATFTTSGHAARHGKKHTGEKGVHCPTCGKAFTRKDNMKQHERTHKNPASATNSSDESRKTTKAAVTKAAVAERNHKRNISEAKSAAVSKDIHSPLSEVTSSVDMAQHALTTPVSNPVSTVGEPILYEDDVSGLSAAHQAQPETMMPTYPPLDDVTLGQINQQAMPAFPRTFSDLDTLAMAASYDPYNHNGQHM